MAKHRSALRPLAARRLAVVVAAGALGLAGGARGQSTAEVRALGSAREVEDPSATEPAGAEWRVAGLTSPAEILVDRWGIAHLYAADVDDLFFLRGFNAARDRLWQLDLWRRRGEGRLAEVLGPRYVDQDRAARLLLYRGDLYPEWLAYASDTKRIVGAFVRGINAFIELTEQRPELLPEEFAVLGYRPAPWQPESVVRIRSHGLLRNLRSEVARARFLQEHGVATGLRWSWLRDHLEPEHRLEVPAGLDLETPLPKDLLATYELGTAAVRFPDDLLARLRDLGPGGTRPGPDPVAPAAMTAVDEGSNNWAVSAARTATGRPLLANDPHRSVTVPSLRYIVHLSAPGLDVIGAGEPALPGVSIGHNGTVAFGLTIFDIDQEDLYVYETNPENPREIRYQDRWEPMAVVREEIAVRGGEPAIVELAFTRHGPVLFEDPTRHRAYALRAAWLEPGMAPYLGSIGLMRARSWDEFLAAMNRWGAPSENQVFADVHGDIGWKPGGRTPVRRGWDGLLPVPGDGRYEWAGYRDMDELPVEHDPTRGWVASANQMNLPDGFDRPTGYEWAAPYRYQRIAEVLSASPRLSVADAQALQTDTTSIPARRAVAVLAEVAEEGATPSAREALRLLRSWDARLQPTSAAAALFEVWWRRHLRSAVVGALIDDPALREDVRGDGEVVLRLLEAPDTRWGAAPGSRRDRALLESLAAAWEETSELLGADAARWQWGSLHVADLVHPVAGLLPADRRQRWNVGPLPRGGSGDTPGATSYDDAFRQTGGASFRMVIDVGNWDDSVAMNTPGQSGDSRSTHYRDLFADWAANRSVPLLYSRAAVEREVARRLELVPAGRAH